MYNHLSKQQVLGLKHQVARDLAWSLWGPALFLHPNPYSEIRQEHCFPLDRSWLTEIDQDPRKLLAYLKVKNTYLLGTYFEALWQFYFSHHPSFNHCVCNLQVNDMQRTLGEFDVLVSDHHGQSFHIELACKFYLAWQDSQNTRLWIGPNCADRLDIKFHKTNSHQLPLLKTDLGKQACEPAFGPSETIQQLAIWRGNAFYPSHWLRANELEYNQLLQELGSRANILWFIAPKQLWLSPVTQDKKHLKSFSQIKQDIAEHFQHRQTKKPSTLMLISLKYDKDNQQWQQHEALLITPNNWPYGKLAESALTPLRPCRPPL
ncbi:MAG: DUF1853 family protein [Oleispira sp.]|nr:DUF1853 family protein [Oleispira sp.]